NSRRDFISPAPCRPPRSTRSSGTAPRGLRIGGCPRPERRDGGGRTFERAAGYLRAKRRGVMRRDHLKSVRRCAIRGGRHTVGDAEPEGDARARGDHQRSFRDGPEEVARGAGRAGGQRLTGPSEKQHTWIAKRVAASAADVAKREPQLAVSRR